MTEQEFTTKQQTDGVTVIPPDTAEPNLPDRSEDVRRQLDGFLRVLDILRGAVWEDLGEISVDGETEVEHHLGITPTAVFLQPTSRATFFEYNGPDSQKVYIHAFDDTGADAIGNCRVFVLYIKNKLR